MYSRRRRCHSQRLTGNSRNPGIAAFGSLQETDKVEILRFSMGEEHPEYLDAPLVHEAFAAVASRSPERRCFCYEGEWLSYGEVAVRVADAFAGRLAGLGVGPGVVVGLMLDRSFELVVSMMAVLKAGGCYLPCDPAYPDDRLAVYLEDAAAHVVLVQSQHADRARGMIGANVPIVDVADQVNSGSSAALVPSGPEDPAYIIFTSGSTGRPKGVMVPHKGVKDLMPWLVKMYEYSKWIILCSCFCKIGGGKCFSSMSSRLQMMRR